MKQRLLVLVIIVLAILVYLVWIGKNSTLRRKETNFAVRKPTDITLIELSSAEQKVILHKENKGWKVNNTEANTQKIRDLVLLASRLNVVAPASINDRDSLQKITETAVEINFYRSNRKAGSYRIIKYRHQIYARKPNAKNYYKVAAKGFPNVDLSQLYVADSSYWMNDILIHFSPQNIFSVTIDYPANPRKGFIIKQEQAERFNIYTITGEVLDSLANPETIRQYLHFFSNIAHLGIMDDVPVNIIHDQFFSMKIVLQNKNELTLLGFLLTDPETGDPDSFRFTGYMENTGYFKLKYTDFDPLLVPKEYFLKK